jgi:Tol biopolymer transport system component
MFCKISPDGTRVAFTAGPSEKANLYIYDLKHETSTRLTFNEGFDAAPLWAADSKKIIYYPIAVGSIFSKLADGGGEVEQLGSKLELPHVLYSFFGI